jgi:hypothetical protein
MEEEDIQPQKAKDKDIEEAFISSEFINSIRLITSEDDYKILKSLT